MSVPYAKQGMARYAYRVVPCVPSDPDTAAFERHVLPEIEVLLRVARALTRHDADAEDLVQDTLIRAYRAIGSFDGRHPRAWLLTILRNTHINRNRRQRPHLLGRGDTPSDRLANVPSPDRTETALDLTFEAELERALEGLNEPLRRVIELVDIEGLSYAEAAHVLDIPAGTVMSRLHRARHRIRSRLAHSDLAPKAP